MIMYSPKYGAQDLRRSFKTPEGVYKLQVEKRPGQATSSFDRPFTRITAAEIQDGEDKKSYLIINLGDSLHISLVNNPDKVTSATISPTFQVGIWLLKDIGSPIGYKCCSKSH